VASLFLIFLAVPLARRADTVTTYAITFSGGGTIPTSGSFTYDSAVPQFSNFIVDWGGLSFDLTASANNPYVDGGSPSCIGSSTHAAARLAILTTCNSAGDEGWEAFGKFGLAVLSFQANQSGCIALGPCEEITDDSVPMPFSVIRVSGGGAFSITAVPRTAKTPEPSN